LYVPHSPSKSRPRVRHWPLHCPLGFNTQCSRSKSNKTRPCLPYFLLHLLPLITSIGSY
jgi:hypothetical protein